MFLSLLPQSGAETETAMFHKAAKGRAMSLLMSVKLRISQEMTLRISPAAFLEDTVNTGP